MVFSNLTPLCICFLPHALLCRVVSKISDLLGLFEFFPLKTSILSGSLPMTCFSTPILVWTFWWHGKCLAILCCQGIFDGGYPHIPSFKTTLLSKHFFTFSGLSLVAGVVEGVKFFFELVPFDFGVFHSHVPLGQGFLPSIGFSFAVTVLRAFFQGYTYLCLVFGFMLDLSFKLNLIFPTR